ncbi:MAG: N-acetylneuraminate synthase family protein [Deltaproteobacteria bacterium]|nr:N-acetylneuraminate synthase family protein [Deltaproteobacteria bacterium]
MEFEKEIALGERRIGSENPCFIVAEIGINHNGDMNLARKEIDTAVEAGADSIKFQNYKTEDFILDRKLTYSYLSQGRKVTESQYELFKRCELNTGALLDLKKYCEDRYVLFHSTPTSVEGVRDLTDIGVKVLKNGSDFLGHLPLIRYMGETGLPTVLSTGMATQDEIAEAVKTFGATGNKGLVLLHCSSLYPTNPEDVHLRKMGTLAAVFNCLIGFSDHTEGARAAVGAVALGACWIEKHFTLDKNLPGPDHRFSSDPQEFKELVKAVRRMEVLLGDNSLGYCTTEKYGRDHYRLSCVSVGKFEVGHVLQSSDIVFRRPSTGLPPHQVKQLIGRKLKKAVESGDPLLLDYVS